jgi:hypothetical protein
MLDAVVLHDGMEVLRRHRNAPPASADPRRRGVLIISAA